MPLIALEPQNVQVVDRDAAIDCPEAERRRPHCAPGSR